VTATEFTFNPFDPTFASDPYPHYAALREQDPVHATPFGPYLLTRYVDVVSVLRDPSMSVEARNALATPMVDPKLLEKAGDRSRGSRAMLTLDPPDHDRLRRLVAKTFTPKTVAQLGPLCDRLVDEALDRAAVDGGLDIVTDLAFPLPFTVISEMLGMPVDRRDDLREWSGALVKTLDPIFTEEEFDAALAAGDAMTEYVNGVIARKREHPTDDLLSALIAAEDDGDMLDEQELIDQVVLLYVAGHETTVNLIANGTLALLRNPEQAQALRADPNLDQNAIEELLRYDPPVQFSGRVTTRDLVLDHGTVPTGSFVMTGLAAANRDPERWGPTAEQLDLGREGAGAHVAFGGGIHHCLGAALARLEGRSAVPALFRRFPGITLVDDAPVYNGRFVLRGMTALAVTV
jgi:cytochrome P450